MTWCNECRTFHIREGYHFPKFEVLEDQNGDEWITLRAVDAEHAAEIWAEDEDDNSAEYSIVSGKYEPVVFVRDQDGVVTKFKVTGESVPRYNAEVLK